MNSPSGTRLSPSQKCFTSPHRDRARSVPDVVELALVARCDAGPRGPPCPSPCELPVRESRTRLLRVATVLELDRQLAQGEFTEDARASRASRKSSIFLRTLFFWSRGRQD